MTGVTLEAPWLSFDLGAEMPVLSWSVNRPGFTRARRILWREVKNRDFPPGTDVFAWADRALQEYGAQDAVLLLTSRPIARFQQSRAVVGDVAVDAVVTLGLSNGERVGARVDYSGRNWGTINVAVRVGAGLAQAALLETLSIAVQARTTAVIDAGFLLPTGIATGTGTDCVAIAAPEGPAIFAGLHTDIGEAVGRAVYDATLTGARHWIDENRGRQNARP